MSKISKKVIFVVIQYIFTLLVQATNFKKCSTMRNFQVKMLSSLRKSLHRTVVIGKFFIIFISNGSKNNNLQIIGLIRCQCNMIVKINGFKMLKNKAKK